MSIKNTSYQTFWGHLQIIFEKRLKPYTFVLKEKEGGR